MLKVALSFDDNCKGNLELADLLVLHDFRATFYLANCPAKGCHPLDVEDIKGLSTLGFEIGGHTVSHPPDLKELNDSELDFEICRNKIWLEGIIDKPINKFCYPRGRHDEHVRAAVKRAGYESARTTVVDQFYNHTGDPFQVPTTVHCFQRTEYNDEYWFTYAKRRFDDALAASKLTSDDVVYHLWGHQWEIDKNNEWEQFRALIQYIRNRMEDEGLITKNQVIGL